MTKPSILPASENLPVFRKDCFTQTLHPNVFYGFFGRAGGISDGVFKGLNCGQGSNDDPAAIAQNRARVAAEIGIDPQHLLSLYQVHGGKCLNVKTSWPASERPQADAMATDHPGLGLGILVADCAPVLFHATKADGSPMVGAAHAGWKGALGGVIEETAKTMIEQGAQAKTLSACIGPCIGPDSYEVSEQFAEPFRAHNPQSQRFFRPALRAGHLMFDLPAYCLWRLERAGIESCSNLERDTFAEEENFYSYRRATHRKEADYGRQIAVIALKI